MTLTIVSESRSGWSPDHEPTPDKTTLDVAVGHETTVKSLGEPVRIQITDVAGDTVVFTTSENMAPRSDDGGINLNDTRNEFRVTSGGSTEFSTATMDGGYNYTVSLAPTD